MHPPEINLQRGWDFLSRIFIRKCYQRQLIFLKIFYKYSCELSNHFLHHNTSNIVQVKFTFCSAAIYYLERDDDDDDGNDGWLPHADIQRLMAHLAIAQFTMGRSLARSSSSSSLYTPSLVGTSMLKKKVKRDINQKEFQMEDGWGRSLCSGFRILSRASASKSMIRKVKEMKAEKDSNKKITTSYILYMCIRLFPVVFV